MGSWEDYTLAFISGSTTSLIGNKGSSTKKIIDVAVMPAMSQLVKMGTRGSFFNLEKYAYDVVTRLATAEGSKNTASATFGDFKLKVDIGKCFYRSTTRGIYPYLN